MASGWTGTHTDERAREALDLQAQRSRRNRVLWLVVALTLSLLAAASAGVWAIDRMGDSAHERRQAELAEVATVPGSLIDDLQNERNMSNLTLTGLLETVELPVDTIEEARSAVDSSNADFGRVVRGNETAAAAYDQAVNALKQLDAIRAEVDRDEGPTSLDNLPAALRVYERYSEVIAAVLDGTTRLVVSFDEGELRRGVELVHLTSRQIETATVLITHLVFASVDYDGRLFDDEGNPVDRELVAEIRWLSGDFRRQRAEISELGTGDYAAATTTALRESDEWGFQELVASILDGETFTTDSVLEAISSDPNAGYHGLRTTVEAILREKAPSAG